MIAALLDGNEVAAILLAFLMITILTLIRVTTDERHRIPPLKRIIVQRTDLNEAQAKRQIIVDLDAKERGSHWDHRLRWQIGWPIGLDLRDIDPEMWLSHVRVFQADMERAMRCSAEDYNLDIDLSKVVWSVKVEYPHSCHYCKQILVGTSCPDQVAGVHSQP